MAILIFVRHALPEVDASIPSNEWPLSSEGIRDCRRLRLTLSGETRVVSSAERKAIETLSIVTGCAPDMITADVDLVEVRRKEPVDAMYLDRRRAWIRGEPDECHDGWESFEAVGKRMDAALRRNFSDTTVVGTHGMALTAWLVRSGLVSAGMDAVKYWEGLGFPEVVTVRHDCWSRLTFM